MRERRQVQRGSARPVENDVDVGIGKREVLPQHVIAMREVLLDMAEPGAETLAMHPLRAFRSTRMEQLAEAAHLHFGCAEVEPGLKLCSRQSTVGWSELFGWSLIRYVLHNRCALGQYCSVGKH